MSMSVDRLRKSVEELSEMSIPMNARDMTDTVRPVMRPNVLMSSAECAESAEF